MSIPVLSSLAAASYIISGHSDAEHRFWGTMSLLADLSTQSDDHGVFIASEEAAKMVSGGCVRGAVTFNRGEQGEVINIDYEAAFPDHSLVDLAAEIALLDDARQRHIILEASALALLRDGSWDGVELKRRTSELRRQEIDLEKLGLAMPAGGAWCDGDGEIHDGEIP